MAFFKYNNKKIFYNEFGDNRKKLVLLHGNTASSKMFDDVIEKYISDFQVIVIDFLGFGQSDRVDKLNMDLWYDEARQVICLLDLKKYKKVNLIGTSGGAIVAINVALERPDLVNKVIADSFEGEHSLDIITKNIIKDRHNSKSNKNTKNFYYLMNGKNWEKSVDVDTKAIYDHSINIKNFFHKDLKELSIPILFTGSKEDKFLSVIGNDYYEKTFTEMIKKVKDGTMHIFEHGFHPSMLSNFNEFLTLSKKFIIDNKVIKNKNEIFDIFYGKETWDMWRKFKDVEILIEENSDIYNYFDEIKNMLLDKDSHIKMRGFRIICKLSKWDKENKINEIIDLLLNVLDNEKPTIVRMCLSCINNLILYKPELYNKVKFKLNNIDLTKYKDTIAPLIKKDIDSILIK